MFDTFKKKLQKNIEQVIKGQTHLFVTDVEKDALWDIYLQSFPLPDRQESTCNACRQFIKNYSNVVVIKDSKLESIWGFDAGDKMYQQVIDNLHKLVVSKPIKDIFVTDTRKLGTDSNTQAVLADNGNTINTIVWQHLYYELPKEIKVTPTKDLDSAKGPFRDAKNVFKRSLDELSLDSIDAVLELIAQNSLYRGAEFKGVLEAFLKCKKEYDKLPKYKKDNYCWINSISNAGTVSKIRNTSIGTLLIDISGGMELDQAVGRFEKIMAPSNYKRPTPVVTNKMVESAEKTIKDLGYLESLHRQLCCPEDLNVKDMFFVNRSIKNKDLFGELKDATPINPRSLSKVEEISLEDFVNKIMPKAESVEILLENKHISNLVSLIGPAEKESPSLFKWPNSFSWSYRNALADSLKEKVKTAGGKVEGMLRVSLEWFNYNDLDLHLIEPQGYTIHFGNRGMLSSCGGVLDVDMNVGPTTRTPVENIIYQNDIKMKEGKYSVYVNCYTYRENINPNINLEIEFNGEIYSIGHGELTHKKGWHAAEFTYSKKDGIKLLGDVQSSISSQKVWNLDTNKFHKVSVGLVSPNYWGDSKVGNKHIFFALDGAINDDGNIRGFFNEFLSPELEQKHKRVFEILAGRMKVEKNENPKQISGLGFSTTIDNSFICKVSGAFNRTLRVKV